MGRSARQGGTILGPSSVWPIFQTTLGGFCRVLTPGPLLKDWTVSSMRLGLPPILHRSSTGRPGTE